MSKRLRVVSNSWKKKISSCGKINGGNKLDFNRKLREEARS